MINLESFFTIAQAFVYTQAAQETFILPHNKILAVKIIIKVSESIFWGRVGKM